VVKFCALESMAAGIAAGSPPSRRPVADALPTRFATRQAFHAPLPRQTSARQQIRPVVIQQQRKRVVTTL
jgi:hypothetical protein